MLLWTVREMMASELASLLVTTGGESMSCGRPRAAPATLSRTSFAAASRFASRLNSTVMLLVPWLLDEEMLRTPEMPLIAFSSGSVIWDSMTSAFAPAYEVRTVMIGGSMAGYSRTPRKWKLIAPNRRIAIDMTIARTGRRMLTAARLIVGARALEDVDGDLEAGTHLHEAGGDDGVAGGDAGEDLGSRLIAGSIVVLGAAKGRVGYLNRRGSIVLANARDLGPTYIDCGAHILTFAGLFARSLRTDSPRAANGAGGQINNPPFKVYMRSPEFGIEAIQMSDYLRFGTGLDNRLTELAIILAARNWDNDYIWTPHYAAAVKAGVDPSVGADIAAGSEAATIVARAAAPLVRTTWPLFYAHYLGLEVHGVQVVAAAAEQLGATAEHAVEFVDQFVHCGVQVFVGALGKHVVAFDADVAFRTLTAFFFFLVLDAEQHLHIDHLVKVTGDSVQLAGHVAAQGGGDLHVMAGDAQLHGVLLAKMVLMISGIFNDTILATENASCFPAPSCGVAALYY